MSMQALIIMATIVTIFPFALWFIRNWMKIILKREYRWLNLAVIFSFIIGVILFIVFMLLAFML